MALIIFVGCGKLYAPTVPAEMPVLNGERAAGSSQHTCLGYWQFQIDPVSESIDFIPLRTAEIHMNGLAFMEPPAGVALAIDDIVDFSAGEVTVDIAVSHPYPGMDFATAFDVSGILISHGSTYFPFSDEMFFADGDDVQLLNPDGYMRWWNPVEFPENPDKPQFGYIDGLLGKPHSVADFTSTLNGYKYFASDLTDPEAPLSDLDVSMRGAMVPGTTCIRRYQIGFSPGNLVFNYAIDASWAPAVGDPPFDIPDDFPTSANRPEAYRYEIQNVNNTLTYDPDSGIASGTYAMSVYVYDWFEPGNNMVCAFPQNDELMGMCQPDPAEVYEGYSVFGFDLMPMFLSSSDDFLMWIGIECKEYGYQGALPYEIQGVYFQEWIPVAEE